MKPLILCLALATIGCLRLEPKPNTPQQVDCAALDNAHVGFIGAATGMAGMAGAGGVVTASYDNSTVRVGVGVSSALLAVGGVVFTLVGNYEAQQYAAAGCGTAQVPMPLTPAPVKTP